jgi:hypothetical protein
LLGAFDGREVPFLYAGGPTSDSQSVSGSADGHAVGCVPAEHVRDADRADLAPGALTGGAELYGGAEAGLPPHVEQQWGGTLRGLRDIYREGLAIVDDVAVAELGAAFVALGPDDQDAVLAALDGPGVFPPDPVRKAKFLDHVIRHTIEGCLSAPEYGGNQDGAGWRMVGLEGDSQPLGYSIYVAPTDSLAERPDHPLSTANPDELVGGVLTPKPLSADGAQIQATIASYTGALENLSPAPAAARWPTPTPSSVL